VWNDSCNTLTSCLADAVGMWLAGPQLRPARRARRTVPRRAARSTPARVGWQIREQLWGRGFVTGSGRAALEFAFDDLNADHVMAFTEAHNLNSRRVMERLGMHYRQRFHRRGPAAGTGEVRDDAVLVLYRTTRPS